jgi:hypothetical protein
VGRLKAAGNVMDKAYQTEDNVFRLAAYMQAINDGKSITDAGKFASEAFVDYNITAPAISMARQTVLPFIAWPYRMIPAMLRIAVFKPWKIATLVTALHGLNALGYAIAGGDEDEERKFLPETRQGALGGLLPVPKAIRMPWNTGDNSTYYDMTVLFPTGDLLGLGSATVFGAKLPCSDDALGAAGVVGRIAVRIRHVPRRKDYLACKRVVRERWGYCEVSRAGFAAEHAAARYAAGRTALRSDAG